jgi:hypothetical protein
MTGISFATMSDTRVSGNVIIFQGDTSNGIYVVTFNSVNNRVILYNDGPTILEVDLRCISPVDGTFGYASSASCVVYLPPFGVITPNTVDLNFATSNLAFEMERGKAWGKIRYTVTGDRGTL